MLLRNLGGLEATSKSTQSSEFGKETLKSMGYMQDVTG